MLTPGQMVVVGVSGGPDSTALLHALTQLRDEWRLSLVACHVNHGFRGEEAEADADYVQALCDSLNVPCRVEMIDVPALQKRRHLSAQQAARDARHAFLRRVASEVGAERIALAHTRNDRTETVCLNILRGGGLAGLAGFAPVSLPLIRPLYDVTRAQVEQYCNQFHLAPRYDSSNAKLTYRRNRIRTELLPQLRELYNPKVDDALLRLADLAAEDNALLESLALQSLQSLAPLFASSDADALLLPLTQFNALPLSLRRRVLRQAIAQTRGNLQDVSFEKIEAILEAAAEGRKGSVELPSNGGGTLQVRCDASHVAVLRALPPSDAVPWQMSLVVPGRTFMPGRNVVVYTQVCPSNELPSVLQQLRSEFRNEFQGQMQAASLPAQEADWRGQMLAWPLDGIQHRLVVRGWKPGDRIRPRGLNGTKKIQDIFTDLKVPARQRPHLPLLAEENGGRVLAAGEWRVDETTLLACHLPCADSAANEYFEAVQRKIATQPEVRELLAALFLYQ